MTRARRAAIVPSPTIAALLFLAWGGTSPPPASGQADDPTTNLILRASLNRVEQASPRYSVGTSNVLRNVLKTGLNAPRPAGEVRPGLEMEPGPLAARAPQATTPAAQADLASAALLRGLRTVTGANPPPREEILRVARDQEPNARAALQELAGPRAGRPPRVGERLPDLGSTPGASRDPGADFFDWRFLAVVRTAKNQGQCGCCWAFGTNGAFEAAYAIRNNYRVSASEQFLLNCSGKGSCNGGWWAFDSIIGGGVAKMADDPFRGQDQLRCPGSPSAPLRAVKWGYVTAQDVIPTTAEMKAALCAHGPLAVAVNATPYFLQYRSGVFSEQAPPSPGNGAPVNHAVTLVGWDDTKHTWAIKNSWDTDWGQDGFMDIDYGSNNIGYGAAWVQAAAVDAPGDNAAIGRDDPDPRGNGAGDPPARPEESPKPAVPAPSPSPGPASPEDAAPSLPRDASSRQEEVTPPRISTPKAEVKQDRGGG